LATDSALDLRAPDIPTGVCEVEMVSVTSTGQPANDTSRLPSISADGRMVMFQSFSTNLPGGSKGQCGLWLRDTKAEVTTLVSLASTDGQCPVCIGRCLSDDGRFAAFATGADLAPDDTNGTYDVYRRDLASGDLVVVSAASSSGLALGSSSTASISGDGQFVGFLSSATALGAPPAYTKEAFLRDIAVKKTTMLSVLPAGSPCTKGTNAVAVANKGALAYLNTGCPMVADDQTEADLYLRHVGTSSSTLISKGADGKAVGGVSQMIMASADGERVVLSAWREPGTGTLFHHMNIFMVERSTQKVRRVSVPADGRGEPNADCAAPSISSNGRYVTFCSVASNLVPGDTNGEIDVFRVDLETNQIERVTVTPGGAQGYYGGGLFPGDNSAVANDGTVVFDTHHMLMTTYGRRVYTYRGCGRRE
jgi:Tol biopolymer transport system component